MQRENPKLWRASDTVRGREDKLDPVFRGGEGRLARPHSLRRAKNFVTLSVGVRAHRRSGREARAGCNQPYEIGHDEQCCCVPYRGRQMGDVERRKEGEGSMTPVLPPSSAKMLEATGSYLTVGVLAAGRACTN